jgi:crotonobetainyl-CoA:carnitine CoA-transferase CaiB-like acyl-CoA transferase
VEHYEEMTELVESVTTTRTTAAWLKVLQEHQVAAGPINTVEDAFQDPGVKATGMVKTIKHPKAGDIELLDKPWHLSTSSGGLRLPPPALGQHTDEVLLAHGFSGSEIAQLKQHEVVFGP